MLYRYHVSGLYSVTVVTPLKHKPIRVHLLNMYSKNDGLHNPVHYVRDAQYSEPVLSSSHADIYPKCDWLRKRNLFR